MRFFLILFTLNFALAAELIDLGTIEIDGEVRRPLIEYTSTDITTKNVLNGLILRSLDEFMQMLRVSTSKKKDYSFFSEDIGSISFNKDLSKTYQALERSF